MHDYPFLVHRADNLVRRADITSSVAKAKSPKLVAGRRPTHVPTMVDKMQSMALTGRLPLNHSAYAVTLFIMEDATQLTVLQGTPMVTRVRAHIPFPSPTIKQASALSMSDPTSPSLEWAPRV